VLNLRDSTAEGLIVTNNMQQIIDSLDTVVTIENFVMETSSNAFLKHKRGNLIINNLELKGFNQVPDARNLRILHEGLKTP
jgi:hypothetical protein